MTLPNQDAERLSALVDAVAHAAADYQEALRGGVDGAEVSAFNVLLAAKESVMALLRAAPPSPTDGVVEAIKATARQRLIFLEALRGRVGETIYQDVARSLLVNSSLGEAAPPTESGIPSEEDMAEFGLGSGSGIPQLTAEDMYDALLAWEKGGDAIWRKEVRSQWLANFLNTRLRERAGATERATELSEEAVCAAVEAYLASSQYPKSSMTRRRLEVALRAAYAIDRRAP